MCIRAIVYNIRDLEVFNTVIEGVDVPFILFGSKGATGACIDLPFGLVYILFGNKSAMIRRKICFSLPFP